MTGAAGSNTQELVKRGEAKEKVIDDLKNLFELVIEFYLIDTKD